MPSTNNIKTTGQGKTSGMGIPKVTVTPATSAGRTAHFGPTLEVPGRTSSRTGSHHSSSGSRQSTSASHRSSSGTEAPHKTSGLLSENHRSSARGPGAMVPHQGSSSQSDTRSHSQMGTESYSQTGSHSRDPTHMESSSRSRGQTYTDSSSRTLTPSRPSDAITRVQQPSRSGSRGDERVTIVVEEYVRVRHYTAERRGQVQ
ncbi:hypothetical protein FB567DRAFT_592359 [Paraphoma chrysanthemicola]|uniref:Uncharacterized protein n=1 Tax=Paraphoma chrysanthemicola TaxID=798071 RepID=A0A8K0VZ81_9PLEO|nr:hypothetical protein FB567DRAFT_592359 [Paraphoma chrysanthemicola]